MHLHAKYSSKWSWLISKSEQSQGGLWQQDLQIKVSEEVNTSLVGELMTYNFLYN